MRITLQSRKDKKIRKKSASKLAKTSHNRAIIFNNLSKLNNK